MEVMGSYALKAQAVFDRYDTDRFRELSIPEFSTWLPLTPVGKFKFEIFSIFGSGGYWRGIILRGPVGRRSSTTWLDRPIEALGGVRL